MQDTFLTDAAQFTHEKRDQPARIVGCGAASGNMEDMNALHKVGNSAADTPAPETQKTRAKGSGFDVQRVVQETAASGYLVRGAPSTTLPGPSLRIKPTTTLQRGKE